MKTPFHSDSRRRTSSLVSSRTPRTETQRCSTFIARPESSARMPSSSNTCSVSCSRLARISVN
ncbi:MAG: hypothetical protein DMF06_02345 [Verrucomicrobia bacterium]|nr:MAG: hypothetical protein DMF06_02345 [Verrucomicrobiota bacterium]